MISSSQRPLPDNTRHSQQTNIHAPVGFEPKISEESYRLCCVVVCDLETSRMGVPYIYDISRLRVKWSRTANKRRASKTGRSAVWSAKRSSAQKVTSTLRNAKLVSHAKEKHKHSQMRVFQNRMISRICGCMKEM